MESRLLLCLARVLFKSVWTVSHTTKKGIFYMISHYSTAMLIDITCTQKKMYPQIILECAAFFSFINSGFVYWVPGMRCVASH